MRTLLALAWVVLISAACADTNYRTATEVIVEIDTDDSLKALARSVRVRVEGGDGLNDIAQRMTRLEETLSVADFPRRVALVPLAGGGAERVYVVTATALDGDGAFLAEARLVGGYVSGQVRYARLVIEGSLCLGVRCEDPRSTCSAGVCTEASIDVQTLSEDSTRPGHRRHKRYPSEVSAVDISHLRRNRHGASHCAAAHQPRRNASPPCAQRRVERCLRNHEACADATLREMPAQQAAWARQHGSMVGADPRDRLRTRGG